VPQAARNARVKIPTAKAILYLYRKEKRIYVRKDDSSLGHQIPETNVPEIREEFRIENVNQTPAQIEV